MSASADNTAAAALPAELEAEAKRVAREHANQAVEAAKGDARAAAESAAAARVDAALGDEAKDADAFLKSVPDDKVRAAAVVLASLEVAWEGHVAADARLSALNDATKLRLRMAYGHEVAEATFKGLNGLDVDKSLSDVVTPEGSTVNLDQFYEAPAKQFTGDMGKLQQRGKELTADEAQLMERALLAAMLMYKFKGGRRAVRELNNVIKDKVKDETRRLKAIKAFKTAVAPVVIFQDLKKKDGPKHFIVASCGTRGPMSNIWDWICDFKVLMDDSSGEFGIPEGVKLHTGFYGAFQDLADADETVNEELAGLREDNPNCTFTFTGHSLGGAVAQLLAISYAGVTGSKSRLVTFGCPRGGDAKFQELSKARTEHIRVRAIGDPIAGVPTERKLLPWSYPAHLADKYLLVQDDMPAILEEDGSKPVEKVRFIFSALYFLYRFYGNHRGYQYAAGVLSHFGVELDVKSSWWNPF